MIPPVIMPKLKSNPNISITKCSFCQLDCTIKHNPVSIKKAAVHEKQAIIPWDKYEVGYFVSEDQFVVKLLVVSKVNISVRYFTFVFVAGILFDIRPLV